MHKTKPISKESLPRRHHGYLHDYRFIHHSIFNIPACLEEQVDSTEEETYSISDFLLSLEAERCPYYDLGLESAVNSAPPLRPRPCVERINQEYLHRMGQPTLTSHQQRVILKNQVRVKYFREEDAPACIGEYQEQLESVKEEEAMAEEMEE